MKRNINTDINRVYISALDCYENEKVQACLVPLLENMLNDNGIDKAALSGKKVVLKPNLLAKREADAGITAHPSFVAAAGKFFVELGAAVIIADSPGGVYNQGALEGIYKVTGMNDAAEKSGAVTNKDTDFVSVHEPDVSALKFNIINPINDADLIVNLARLKTHALCEVSLAVKNMFGAIPGLQKAEQHARFPKRMDFADMLYQRTEGEMNLFADEHIKNIAFFYTKVFFKGARTVRFSDGGSRGNPGPSGIGYYMYLLCGFW